MSVPGAAPGTKRVKPKSLVVEKPEIKGPAAGASSGSRKPDRAAHDVEVKTIEAEIDQVKAKNEQLRAKIPTGNQDDPVNQERKKLRDELKSLRDAQAGMKANRGKTQDQIRNMQERMQSKIKDLNTARGKFPYKSGAEVDAKIASLEKQVESGNLKLVDERKALSEISTLRKSRKTVDGFASQQAAIEEDRRAIDAAKAKLDDPEAKAASDKYSGIQAQLDKLNEQADEAYKNRSKLYEQRDANKKQLDELYTKRRELKDAFRAANDAYYQKMNEDRAKKAERQKAEKAAYEESKRKEVNEQLLEEASQPAFEREIEDCATLIEYFSRGGGKSTVPAPKLATSGDKVPKVPAHDLRKVDAIPEGATVLKKKGDDDERDGLFGGMGGGKKGKKGGRKQTEDSSSSTGLQLPMSTLSALMTLEVPSPITSADVPKTVEALQEKQQWFKQNQAKTTEERIAAAKARIERATKAVEGKSAPVNGSKTTAAKKIAETAPTLEHRDSAEPMQVGSLEASEAAQADAVEDSNDGEPTATVNESGEALNAASP